MLGTRTFMIDIAFVAVAIRRRLTFTYAGHGDTGRLVPLGFVADLADVGAAALWLGGIAVLAVGLRDPFELWGATRATARFSKLALPAIVVLALSGAVQAWRQTGTWASPWETTYGHLLVAKVVVVCALIVAVYASRDVLRLRLVPALKVASVPGAARLEAEPDDARELRNGVWVEAGLAVIILAITAALVNSQPARRSRRRDAAHRHHEPVGAADALRRRRATGAPGQRHHRRDAAPPCRGAAAPAAQREDVAAGPGRPDPALVRTADRRELRRETCWSRSPATGSSRYAVCGPQPTSRSRTPPSDSVDPFAPRRPASRLRHAGPGPLT